MNKIALPLLLFALSACSDADPLPNPPDVDMDLGVEDTALDVNDVEDASMDEGSSDIGQTDLSQADANNDSDHDADDPDAGDSGQTQDLPFRGELTMTGDFIRETRFPVEVDADGVLVVELYSASVDLDAIRYQLCRDNSCVGSSFRAPPRDFVPLRLLSNVTPGSYELDFSISSFTEPEGPQTLEIGVEILTVQTIDTPPQSAGDALELGLPGAFRASLSAGVPAWFQVNLARPGFLSILRTNNNTYFCDMAAWAPNPEGCRYSARETEGDVENGLLFLISESTFDTTRDFVVFHDEDPNALVCANGLHPAGDQTCVPEGTCAPGYHDGGWGRCVATDTCSPNFELRSDGRCEGWVSAGELDAFDSVNEAVVAGPNDTVIVSGLQRNASNESVVAPQVWDPLTRTWSTADTTLSPVGVRRICPLSDGRILTMRYGGFVTTAPADSERIFDPITGLWSTPLNTPGIAWSRPTCVLLQDGRTLVFEGGRSRIFDPSNETWIAAASLPGGSDYVSVESMPGEVFAAGNDAVPAVTRHMWRWDENSDLWTQTPDWMLADELDNDLYMVAFAGDPVLFLTDGRVVRFDTTTNLWEALSPIEVPGSSVYVNGVSSRGGEVLFTYNAQQAGAGVYDIVTGQWRALPYSVLSGRPMISADDFLLVGRYPQRLVIGD